MSMYISNLNLIIDLNIKVWIIISFWLLALWVQAPSLYSYLIYKNGLLQTFWIKLLNEIAQNTWFSWQEWFLLQIAV